MKNFSSNCSNKSASICTAERKDRSLKTRPKTDTRISCPVSKHRRTKMFRWTFGKRLDFLFLEYFTCCDCLDFWFSWPHQSDSENWRKCSRWRLHQCQFYHGKNLQVVTNMIYHNGESPVVAMNTNVWDPLLLWSRFFFFFFFYIFAARAAEKDKAAGLNYPAVVIVIVVPDRRRGTPPPPTL